jgi:hypothetical protein
MDFASQGKSLIRESLLVFFLTLLSRLALFLRSFKKVREAFLFKPCFEIR